MADFEFFKKEFEFKGKHAKMAQELWVRDDMCSWNDCKT